MVSSHGDKLKVTNGPPEGISKPAEIGDRGGRMERFRKNGEILNGLSERISLMQEMAIALRANCGTECVGGGCWAGCVVADWKRLTAGHGWPKFYTRRQRLRIADGQGGDEKTCVVNEKTTTDAAGGRTAATTGG